MKFKTFILELKNTNIEDFLQVSFTQKEESLLNVLGYEDNIPKVWNPIFNVCEAYIQTNCSLSYDSRNKEFDIKRKIKEINDLNISETIETLRDEIPEHFEQFYYEGIWNYYTLLELESPVNSENIKTISILDLITRANFNNTSFINDNFTKAYLIKASDTSHDVRKFLISLLSTSLEKNDIIHYIIANEAREIFGSTNYTYLRRIVKVIDSKAKISKLADIPLFIENNIELCIKNIFHFSIGSIQSALNVNFINEVQLRKYSKYKGKFNDGHIIPIRFEEFREEKPCLLITSFDYTTHSQIVNYLGAFTFYLTFFENTFSIHGVPNTQALKYLKHTDGTDDAPLISYVESIITLISDELEEGNKTRTSIIGVPISKAEDALDFITTILDTSFNRPFIEKIKSNILSASQDDCVSIELPTSFSNTDIRGIFETSIKGYAVSFIKEDNISNIFKHWTEKYSNVSVKFDNFLNTSHLDPYEFKEIYFRIRPDDSTLKKSDVSDILKNFTTLSKDLKDKTFSPVVPLNSKIEILNIEIGRCLSSYLNICEDEIKDFLTHSFLRHRDILSYSLDKYVSSTNSKKHFSTQAYSNIDQELASDRKLEIDTNLINSWHKKIYLINNTEESKLMKLVNLMLPRFPIIVHGLILASLNKYSKNATTLTKSMIKNSISTEAEIVTNLLNDYSSKSNTKAYVNDPVYFEISGFYPSKFEEYMKV